MNSDEIQTLVRNIAVSLLSSGAAAAYVSQEQAAALASGLAALAVLIWSVWAHWNQRPVPETAVVTSHAPTVTMARELSAPAVAAATAAQNK